MTRRELDEKIRYSAYASSIGVGYGVSVGPQEDNFGSSWKEKNGDVFVFVANITAKLYLDDIDNWSEKDFLEAEKLDWVPAIPKSPLAQLADAADD